MEESTYQAAAQAYADGVRVLFAPSGAPTGERGGLGPTSPDELADQAERLAPLSAELTQAMAAGLADADPAVRAQASTQLLAKALTDLEIGLYLLQAAEDEEYQIAWAGGPGTERSRGGLGATVERLDLLLGEGEAVPAAVERGEQPPGNVRAARVMLSDAIADALDLISDRASKTGQAALSGLLGLGGGEVAQVAGAVGMDFAQALGQADKVTQLYNLFRDFALKAYDSLVALLGQQLAQTAAQRVVEWFEEFKEGEQFAKLLERLYETDQTRRDLGRLVAESRANLESLTAAIQRVDGLDAAFGQQADLSEKLLRGLKVLALVPATALPQGRLLMAAAYVVLGAYVVLAGGDYVDARRLERLGRVPGVRRVVEGQLAAA
ncbi:MAG TPA: hypothetical protein VMY35_00590 [Phycisphaerae bacterium]|nr:hypothetical protein [Phycisphaerae bacterium]